MRIGIVGHETDQVTGLLNELAGHNILWVAGSVGDLSSQCPVYLDYSEAISEQQVDIVIDCTGGVSIPEAMVVPLAAALYLLGENRSKAIVPYSPALTGSASQLSAAIDKISTELAKLDSYARQLTEVGAMLDAASRGVLGDLDRTGRILDSITRIAKRSKIIGLNSAIEAARVGEQGRGFAVVAEEIKSLADDSSQSVQDIAKILEGIQRRSDDFVRRTGVVNEVSDLQLQTTRHIAAMLQGLKELGQHLQKLSEEQSA